MYSDVKTLLLPLLDTRRSIKLNFTKKAILGLILALIVGGLGSGVWEYIFKPLLTWSADGILNIATLGVQSFKNDMYQEIAKGFHEASSLSLSNAVYFWVGYGFVFSLFVFTKKTKEVVTNISDTGKKIDALEAVKNGEVELPEKCDINDQLFSLRENNSRLASKAQFTHKASYGLLVLGVALFAWMLVVSAKAKYINSAIVYYEQSLSVVAPLATEDELSMIKSRFAQIASKNDYEELLVDISTIGERGQLNIPVFKIW